jgi:hypothetical protein
MPMPMTSDQRQGLVRLAGITAVAAVIWLILLPLLSMFPPMSERLQWLDDQRVDPSAMYYTEVDALKPVLQRLNERGRARSPHPR